MSEVKVIKFDDFCYEAKIRFGDDSRNWKYKCPMCGTSQSAKDFAELDCFKDKKEEINKYVGFSCIGRFVEGKGCDWTLGGLLQFHKLEIEDKNGIKHRHFELADKG